MEAEKDARGMAGIDNGLGRIIDVGLCFKNGDVESICTSRCAMPGPTNLRQVVKETRD